MAKNKWVTEAISSYLQMVGDHLVDTRQQLQIYKQSFHTEIELSGQISIIPKPELRGFWGSSLIKPPFRVTSADIVIICPEL